MTRAFFARGLARLPCRLSLPGGYRLSRSFLLRFARRPFRRFGEF
jgi:hypothetical protein